jgi:excinuclease ABC subunit C
VVRASDEEIMEALLKQFYVGATTIPKDIHIMCGTSDEEAINEWLQSVRHGPVAIRVPQRGDKATVVRLAAKNARVLLTERRLKRDRQKKEAPHTVRALQRDLHLGNPPRCIEAMDISNIHGSDAVGSLVSFRDGKPKKSEYRRFKIQRVEGSDDFAMMREVVHRRFSRLLKEEKKLPDLLLVDGGKGQLSSALASLEELGIVDQPVVGLAKRLEEVYLPGDPDPQNIPKTSSSLKLLQAIRDEAHRFAVTYHRKVRGRRAVASSLDDIPGVGAARKTSLLRRFGSVAQIAQADPKAIAEAAHIGEGLARSIREHLQKRPGGR